MSIRLRGPRTVLPPGYLVGRLAGTGAAEAIDLTTVVAALKRYGLTGVTSFLGLTDTPSSYSGAGSKVVRVNSGATALEFHNEAFLDLADTPANYTGAAGKAVQVNAGETGLEFVTPSSSLAGLSDVTITTPADGEVLTYVTAASKWENKPIGSIYTPPTTAIFSTAVNHGAETWTDVSGYGIASQIPKASTGGALSLKGRVKTVPVSTPYTITCACVKGWLTTDFWVGGMMLFETATNKIVTFGFGHNTNAGILIQTFTSPTVFSATSANDTHWVDSLIWFRVHNDGSNLSYQVSHDGTTWGELLSTTLTAFFTTAPSHWGFFINGQNGSGHDINLGCIHYAEA